MHVYIDLLRGRAVAFGSFLCSFIHLFLYVVRFLSTDILHDKSVREYCIAYLLIDRHTSQGQKVDFDGW